MVFGRAGMTGVRNEGMEGREDALMWDWRWKACVDARRVSSGREIVMNQVSTPAVANKKWSID